MIKKNTLPSLFVMLEFLVSCYMIFVLRNIIFFNMHTLISQYAIKTLSSIHSLEISSFFIKPQNVITIPYIWNEIKLSLGFWTCLLLIEKRMKCWRRLACGGRHDGNFNDTNSRKIQLVKNERVLEVKLARNKIHRQI